VGNGKGCTLTPSAYHQSFKFIQQPTSRLAGGVNHFTKSGTHKDCYFVPCPTFFYHQRYKAVSSIATSKGVNLTAIEALVFNPRGLVMATEDENKGAKITMYSSGLIR